MSRGIMVLRRRPRSRSGAVRRTRRDVQREDAGRGSGRGSGGMVGDATLCGCAGWRRGASASQAECRGFKSLRPLHTPFAELGRNSREFAGIRATGAHRPHAPRVPRFLHRDAGKCSERTLDRASGEHRGSWQGGGGVAPASARRPEACRCERPRRESSARPSSRRTRQRRSPGRRRDAARTPPDALARRNASVAAPAACRRRVAQRSGPNSVANGIAKDPLAPFSIPP